MQQLFQVVVAGVVDVRTTEAEGAILNLPKKLYVGLQRCEQLVNNGADVFVVKGVDTEMVQDTYSIWMARELSVTYNANNEPEYSIVPKDDTILNTIRQITGNGVMSRLVTSNNENVHVYHAKGEETGRDMYSQLATAMSNILTRAGFEYQLLTGAQIAQMAEEAASEIKARQEQDRQDQAIAAAEVDGKPCDV